MLGRRTEKCSSDKSSYLIFYWSIIHWAICLILIISNQQNYSPPPPNQTMRSLSCSFCGRIWWDCSKKHLQQIRSCGIIDRSLEETERVLLGVMMRRRRRRSRLSWRWARVTISRATADVSCRTLSVLFVFKLKAVFISRNSTWWHVSVLMFGTWRQINALFEFEADQNVY